MTDSIFSLMILAQAPAEVVGQAIVDPGTARSISSIIMKELFGSSFLAQMIYLALFSLSIISWGIIIRKVMEFKAEKKKAEGFRRLFNDLEGNIVALSQEGILPANCLARLFVAAYEELRLWATLDRERNCIVADRPVVPALERTLDRAMENEKARLEEGTTLLASAASAGPLLGLLGTVWGVYLSFQQMSVAGSASITTVAPGISEALLTTVAGLLVAIPAVFSYNWIMRSVRGIEGQMEDFSSEIINRFDRQIVVETNPNRAAQQPMLRRKPRVTT